MTGSLVASIILIVLLIAAGFLMSRIISKPLMTLTALTGKLAEGNLDLNIEPGMLGRKDEIGILSNGLQKAVGKFSNTIEAVKESAYNVNEGALQVSETSRKLSQGANEQAASAEEVSASMEQMSANIKQNADNSGQTEKIAVKAAADAKESGRITLEAVTSMKDIAEKITIIEEIYLLVHFDRPQNDDCFKLLEQIAKETGTAINQGIYTRMMNGELVVIPLAAVSKMHLY